MRINFHQLIGGAIPISVCNKKRGCCKVQRPRKKAKNKSPEKIGALILEAPPGFGPGVRELQSLALPLGYSAFDVFLCRKRSAYFRCCENIRRAEKKWSGLRGSNSLPPPWQGGALPDELNPQMATWMGLEPTTSAVTGRRSNQLNYQAILVGTIGLEPMTLCL